LLLNRKRREPIIALFSPNEKEIYENLIRVAGSEMDIRIRQNIFLAIDKINNNVCTDIGPCADTLLSGLTLINLEMNLMFDKNIPFVVSTKHSVVFLLHENGCVLVIRRNFH
jgi:hypothetical protein